MLKAFVTGIGISIALAGTALAQTCPSSTYVPVTLANGTTADASQVMSNFNGLLNCANNMLAPKSNAVLTGNVNIGNSLGWMGTGATVNVETTYGWGESIRTTGSGGPGALLLRTDNLTAPYMIYMLYGVNTVGAIWTDGTGVGFATTSDYRLKTNIEHLGGALGRVMQLNPIRYNFKAAPQAAKIDGFLAHEVGTVVPNAVIGQKDAVKSDGSINPQQVDYSKLVPLLVAAIQEQQAEIASLNAKVAALQPAK